MALDSPPSEALQKGSICAIVYSNQPASRKSSRYNLNSPLLIPPPTLPTPPITAAIRSSIKNEILAASHNSGRVITDAC
ncbi:unnamed protein product [Gongylonema pulchrum]|uniref:Uncharacterized protein n=1 Tax=Gongylonema pulchrum TaxID=637853 RepID=A0A183DVZ7_9BILA|nr:unnamed protein product [Gongylonema pulchrum]